MGFETRAEQVLCNMGAFFLLEDVADDTEQVSAINAVGESFNFALAFEGGDAGEDGVKGVTSDGVPDVGLGVKKAEAMKGLIEDVSHDGILTRLESLLREFLFAASLIQSSSGLFDLLR